MSTHVCPVGSKRGVSRAEDDKAGDDQQRARTPLAEKGELLVAVLGVPAVKTAFVHAFDLETLQLSTEDAVLGGGLPEIGQTLGRQKHLHRSCNNNKNQHTAAGYKRTFVKEGHLGTPPPNGPPGNGSDWRSHTGSPPRTWKFTPLLPVQEHISGSSGWKTSDKEPKSELTCTGPCGRRLCHRNPPRS